MLKMLASMVISAMAVFGFCLAAYPSETAEEERCRILTSILSEKEDDSFRAHNYCLETDSDYDALHEFCIWGADAMLRDADAIE